MAYKYAQTGPPFNFLGNLSETQKQAFSAWVTKNAASLPETQTFHQIRAQQLRKTAGLLEQFYATQAPDVLAPSFIKTSWKPDQQHHYAYAHRNDHVPAVTVAKVKEYFRSKLVHMDDGMFHMNHLRCQIEKQEDLAQYANDAVQHVPQLLSTLETLFGKPEYQATLVKDQSDLYKNEPRHRVHPLDAPTPWENDTRGSASPEVSA